MKRKILRPVLIRRLRTGIQAAPDWDARKESLISRHVVTWFDEEGRVHRDNDMPAEVKAEPNGYQGWFSHGKVHRETGPAMLNLWDEGFWLWEGVSASPELETLLNVAWADKKLPGATASRLLAEASLLHNEAERLNVEPPQWVAKVVLANRSPYLDDDVRAYAALIVMSMDGD